MKTLIGIFVTIAWPMALQFVIPREQRSVTDLIARLPRAFKDEAAKGFIVLAEINPSHYAEILQAVVVAVEGRKPPITELSDALRLAPSQTNSLFASAMFCVSVLGGDGSPDEFVAACGAAGIIREGLTPKVRPFIDTIVSQQPQIGRTMRRASMPAQVFPAISNFEVVVDLRMDFDDDAVAEVMPVALLHVDTNADGEEIWFQASREQMQQMKSDIEEALRRMDAAETWSTRESKR